MIKNKGKKVVLVLLVLIIAGAVVAYTMWNRPTRTVSNEKGTEITAAALVKAYQANEASANSQFLDKAMQVTGTVGQVDKNQDGKSTIMLTSDDPMTGVYVTLKEGGENVTTGSSITVKGFCSGMLSDVRLREAVIVK